MGKHGCSHNTSPVEEIKPGVEMLLVRKLLACATERSRSVSEQVSDKEAGVLFEAEVDGVRCTLVRKKPVPAPSISLSPREREIARMIAKGYPNKTIAAVLEISAWTVGTHLRRMFCKLNVSSRAALIARVMEIGLLDIVKPPSGRSQHNQGENLWS